jgi:hypothetical protein
MRHPCFWLFGALSVPFLCSPPVFGQNAAPVPGRTPSYPPKETAGFRAYFAQIMAIESLADRLKAQGKDDTTARGAIQKDAGLSAQEAGLLKEVAQQCNADYAAQTAVGTSAVNSLRQQYPPVAGAPSPPAVTQQLAALEAQRTAIVAGCMQQLQTAMGHVRFGYLDLYVLVRVGRKLKQGSLPPGAQGAALPSSRKGPK